MYLKELRAYGFKSFADKTVIEFGKNVNGIVGPNGSGKSNIVDAVRWVLGEQSMKSLRGDSSSDIIFSGSESRKALNSASVTLVFDNEDKTLPIEYNEVAIKRMAFRTGENEYYINNEKVRLKDIVELLSDSGTAKESFNIISQGKIDEILSTKAEDRRAVFEEAAGVLKYKRRKEEAVRKLDKTNQNLNRVNDIISEISTNITPLEEASKKAKKYIEIKDELSTLDVSVIVKSIFDLNNIYQDSKEKITKLENEISSISASSSTYDVDLIKYKDKIKDVREKINKGQIELISLTKKEQQITSDIKILEERNKYKGETSLISNNIIKLKEEMLNIKTSINNINNELEVINKKLSIIKDNIDKLKNKLLNLNNKKNNTNNIIIKNNREIDSLKYRISYLEESIKDNSLLPKAAKSILDNPKYQDGVHNIIANLIDMDSCYSLAINTSLGASTNYLVVDCSKIAKELINYLKDNNLGRLTFYPIDVITPRYISDDIINILNSSNGFIDIASNLIKYNSIYDNIMKNLLGNVIIVDNIDNANNISNLINKKYKIVTLDGQIINVGGSFTGGSKVKNTNTISIRYEIDELTSKQTKLLNSNNSMLKEIDDIDKELNTIKNNLDNEKESFNSIYNTKNNLNDNLNNYSNLFKDKERELDDLSGVTDSDSEENKLINELSCIRENISNLNKELSLLKVEEENINNNITEIEETSRSNDSYLNKKEKELNDLNVLVNRTDVKLDSLLEDLSSDYNMTYDFAKDNYKLDIDINTARNRVKNLKDELILLGNVNLDAPLEYENLKERYDFLTKQKDDLVNAENTLYDIIKEMDSVMKDKFITTFEQIRNEFKVVFRELFKGGRAELILTDPNNILETGVEIKAEPPGKKLQSITLLSGGEKTFTAISLLFAILNIRPVPFCLFDEVEAALDDANVNAFGEYLNKYRDNTQFIIITHKKKTMEYADILYGITMEESGVSKIVSVKLEEIEK